MSGVNWTEEELAARTISEPAQCVKPTPIEGDIKRDELINKLRAKALTPHQRATGRIRQPKGMNKTEARYGEHLEAQKAMGVIAWYKFEGITLKLGHDCRLTFDYAVMTAAGALELHDVKAGRNGRGPHIEEDALAKMRNAAENFPFRVLVVWPGERGEWESKEF